MIKSIVKRRREPNQRVDKQAQVLKRTRVRARLTGWMNWSCWWTFLLSLDFPIEQENIVLFLAHSFPRCCCSCCFFCYWSWPKEKYLHVHVRTCPTERIRNINSSIHMYWSVHVWWLNVVARSVGQSFGLLLYVNNMPQTEQTNYFQDSPTFGSGLWRWSDGLCSGYGGNGDDFSVACQHKQLSNNI